jgi:rhodanese-related sulfurtransferase
MLRYLIYLIPIAVVLYLLWSRRASPATDLKAMLDRKAQIIDVRTKAEFSSASHPRAINIPLNQLEARIKELDRNRPVLVCCASGSRSAAGLALLKKAGFTEVANLGSWQRIQGLLG